MRHVGLAENTDVLEAYEVQGLVHACAVIDTEESMGVGAFLPSLDLDKNWVLKTALLCLLFIQLYSFVDIASFVHILKLDTPGHCKLSLEVLR